LSLWQRVSEFFESFGSAPAGRSAIVPLIVGDENRALEVSATLKQLGVFIPAVRYPTVPRGSARLRLTLTAAHTGEDVKQLISALESVKLRPGETLTRGAAQVASTVLE
jgi:7-keto-8-aminopelargonate synthetase-like enzyme